MTAKPKPKPKAAAAASSASDKIEVILDIPSPKKHVVRFETSVDDPTLALTNVYIKSAAFRALGSPSKLKVTIEPADDA